MLKGGAKTLIDNLSNIIHKYLYSDGTKGDTFDNINQFDYHQLNIFQFIFWGIISKLITITIVYYLWSRVMPNISSSIKENPGFLNLFGLSIIYHLLF
tara:strand:- start:9720 stop:10013 length:294 start_codon:yes stop_codon:yes gene_type:complete